MSVFASLRNRIFLTSALLALLSIGVAIYLVSVQVTRELEQQMTREIIATGGLVEQLRSTRSQTFTAMARLIADAPKLKAAVDTNDPPTVQGTLNDYQNQLNASLLLVTNKAGRVLAEVSTPPRLASVAARQPAIGEAAAGREGSTLLPDTEGMLQLVTVPIAVGLTNPDVLGTLSVGFVFDAALADQLRQITGSDIAFAMNGRVLASTLPASQWAALADMLHHPDARHGATLESEQYVALPLPLSGGQDAASANNGPTALILRSRAEHQRVIEALHTELEVMAVLAVALATVLSFAVARTITRPLAAITRVMREVSATGDLTRKIVFEGRRRWDDEDARLLATTFNTLTDSIARFQRDMSQKERLSSLGRLSTVVAHEVRNPLMIIKATLHTLRQPGLSRDALLEAARDIDEEIVRLNRLVNEVLDFARPLHFDLVPSDVNAICTESAAAAQATPGPRVALVLDPSVPSLVTDRERLRLALVNLIVNARQAVAAANRGEGESAPDGSTPREQPPGVVLSTAWTGERAVIEIADKGSGIDRSDLPHVFDPFFTTRRQGTGLGLPIAKNIIEGLGGTIAVAATSAHGTVVRLGLPLRGETSREEPQATGHVVPELAGPVKGVVR